MVWLVVDEAIDTYDDGTLYKCVVYTWIFVYLLSMLRTQWQKIGIEIQRKYGLPFWCGSFNILIHTNTIRRPSCLNKRLTLLFIFVPCLHIILIFYTDIRRWKKTILLCFFLWCLLKIIQFPVYPDYVLSFY